MDRRAMAALIAVAATWLVVWGWNANEETATFVFTMIGYLGTFFIGVAALCFAVFLDE